MAKRILVNQNNTAFFDPNKIKEASVTVGIDVTPTTLKFKVLVTGKIDVSTYNTETDEIINSQEDTSFDAQNWILNLETLKNDPKFKTNTMYVVNTSISQQSQVLANYNLSNISALTYIQRGSVFSSPKHSVLGNVYIFVKDPNGTFEDFDIIVYNQKTDNATDILSNQTWQERETSVSYEELLDTITVSKDLTYASDDYIKYNISTEQYVDQVYIEAIKGIADKTRVSLSSGIGSFRVLKNSVDQEPITVKVGFPNHPNLVTFIDD